MPGREIVQTGTGARAGVTGHHVRYVLAMSTLGAVAALAAVYFLFFA